MSLISDSLAQAEAAKQADEEKCLSVDEFMELYVESCLQHAIKSIACGIVESITIRAKNGSAKNGVIDSTIGKWEYGASSHHDITSRILKGNDVVGRLKSEAEIPEFFESKRYPFKLTKYYDSGYKMNFNYMDTVKQGLFKTEKVKNTKGLDFIADCAVAAVVSCLELDTTKESLSFSYGTSEEGDYGKKYFSFGGRYTYDSNKGMELKLPENAIIPTKDDIYQSIESEVKFRKMWSGDFEISEEALKRAQDAEKERIAEQEKYEQEQAHKREIDIIALCTGCKYVGFCTHKGKYIYERCSKGKGLR